MVIVMSDWHFLPKGVALVKKRLDKELELKRLVRFLSCFCYRFYPCYTIMVLILSFGPWITTRCVKQELQFEHLLKDLLLIKSRRAELTWNDGNATADSSSLSATQTPFGNCYTV